ncbi:MAG: thiamine-phosphate kinase [Gemmatimonadales bacterium]|jgi:thiamine-monophosphate kinase
MRDLSLGPGHEFDIIRELRARWGSLARGIGDDAAVLSLARGDSLVVSVDTAIAGRHFRHEWLTPREIGYRAAAAALSDLAAMAARPIGVLVALAIPDAMRDRVLDIGDGIGEAAERAGARIVGGNLSGAGELSITTTVLGSVFTPLSRGGARVGDRLFVTGRLGGPAAAIRALSSGVRITDLDAALRERFVRPAPRLAEARWLADRGATAAIDVSDGLVADAGQLAAASGVRLELDAERVPCIAGAELEAALTGGEEFELLVTAPPSARLDAAEFERRFALSLTDIGRVSSPDPPGGAALVEVRGARIAGAPGYDHFSR